MLSIHIDNKTTKIKLLPKNGDLDGEKPSSTKYLERSPTRSVRRQVQRPEAYVDGGGGHPN